MPTLFHDTERIDRTPQGHIEDSFAFLDRVDSPYWERVRTQLDEWYADFPDTDGDLRKRFRSRDPRQHYPAWWELYVYTLLRKLGYAVTVHPEIPDSAGRPDFLAERGDESFYVEAAAVFSGIVAPGRRGQLEAKIKDILDSIPSTRSWSSSTLPRSATQRRVGVPSRSRSKNDSARSTPTTWSRAAPSVPHGSSRSATGPSSSPQSLGSREFRGCPDNTLLATGGAIAGFTDDAGKLRAAIRRKGKHYCTPDRPLVVAVLAANGFVGEHEIVGALFGEVQVRVNIQTGEQIYTRSPDGVWIGKSGPTAKRISAVMLGVSILPTTCATRPVRIWHHYEPARPFTAEIPLPTARVGADGSIDYTDGSASPVEILELTPEWPCPGATFITCKHLPGDHGPYG